MLPMAAYLFDTNTVIDYLEGRLPDKTLDMLDDLVNRRANLSIITKIELLGWYKADLADLQIPADFVRDSHIIGLDDEIVSQTIDIRRFLRIKLPDAIIAATALTYSLTLITRNTQDFKQIPDLELLDPYSM